MSTISASTTTTTAYSVTADTTGALVLQTGATPTTAITVGSDQSVTMAGNLSVTGTTTTTGYINVPNTFGFKNRIINGAMVIDQRNAGASVSPAGSAIFSTDRWKVQTPAGTFQRVTSTLSGFPYSLKYIASGSNAYMQMGQQIEFFNCSDLQSQTVVISFRAKANNTNTGSTALTVRTRTGVTVDSLILFSGTNADTLITLTTTDTVYTVTRTLPSTFGALSLEFVLGSHVSGDGIEITSVQLEKGSTATSFDYRPYGAEFMLCQRYYQLIGDGTLIASGYLTNTLYLDAMVRFPVVMRASPTVTKNGTWNVSGSNGQPTISLSGASGCSLRITATATGQVYATVSGGSGTPTLSADAEF